MIRSASIPLLLGFLLVSMSSFGADLLSVRKISHPAFRTEVVAFEDNCLFDTPADGSLIYRVEGRGEIKRSQKGIAFKGGEAGYIHPAQYDRPSLRLKLKILHGEPGIAICHNGIHDNSGKPNPSPGLEIVLRLKDTAVRNLKSGSIICIIPEALPRNTGTQLTVAWDHDRRLVRVDMPDSSYEFPMPASVTARGGFGLRTPGSPKTTYTVTKVQVLWQDQRECVLYDGYDSVFDRKGKLLGKLPLIKLPDGIVNYATGAVDMKRERALILLGGSDLNGGDPATYKGWAVRFLKTGKLDVLSSGKTVNDCIPFQGGGSMDGYWIMQSWVPPASLSWIDWNAYDRGDYKGFIVPAKVGVKGEGTFTGFHDPSNATDGSMARYLRITESWIGVNHLFVHPNIAAYAPFDDVALPDPTDPRVSHTGPAGLPSQLAVRDKDRAWYEQWAYKGNGLHTQCRGYNLFTRKDDWEGPFCPVEKDAAAYSDYANQAVDLLQPGSLLAMYIQFAPAAATEAEKVKYLGTHRLTWTKGRYVVTQILPMPPWPVPFEMLMDTTGLKH